jgi:hypothetical protein
MSKFSVPTSISASQGATGHRIALLAFSFDLIYICDVGLFLYLCIYPCNCSMCFLAFRCLRWNPAKRRQSSTGGTGHRVTHSHLIIDQLVGFSVVEPVHPDSSSWLGTGDHIFLDLFHYLTVLPLSVVGDIHTDNRAPMVTLWISRPGLRTYRVILKIGCVWFFFLAST